VTLRDGEQQAGIVFSIEQKLEIFAALDALGVPTIETGMAAVSRDELDVVRRAQASDHRAKIFMLARAIASDVQLAASAGADGVTIETIANPTVARGVLGWAPGAAVEKATAAIGEARAQGLAVNMFFVDATRVGAAELGVLAHEISDAAAPDTITIADTFGVCNGRAIAAYVRAVAEAAGVPVYVHCHNEYGLGTSNSMAGVEAGAFGVHTSINGIGERAGNAALEDVVMACRGPHDFVTGIDHTRLRAASALVAAHAGVPVATNKGTVGPSLFTIESGIAATFYEALRDSDLRHFYAYTPDSVDAPVEVLLGKGSGAANIRLRLRMLGREDLCDRADELMAAVKDVATEHLRPLTEDEFLALIEALPALASGAGA
jgi:isopropylmalate/homocitrate/citramalate synthase